MLAEVRFRVKSSGAMLTVLQRVVHVFVQVLTSHKKENQIHREQRCLWRLPLLRAN